MTNIRGLHCVLLGFSLDETILATVVEGFHRSHRYQVVTDAVACRRAGVGDAASSSGELIGAGGKITA